MHMMTLHDQKASCMLENQGMWLIATFDMNQRSGVDGKRNARSIHILLADYCRSPCVCRRFVPISANFLALRLCHLVTPFPFSVHIVSDFLKFVFCGLVLICLPVYRLLGNWY